MAATPVAFSEQSNQRLAGVNPTLADILRETERRALERGIKIEVSEGLRDPGRQAGLVAAGKSQTLNSRHLTGNATDVYIRNPDGSPNWDFEAYRPVADIAKEVAAEMGVPDLVWGGDWKTLKDGVHFQIGGPAGGGSNVSMSTKGGAPMVGLLGMEEEPKTFGERLKESWRSGELADNLALAFNSLTLRPDQNLAEIVGRRQDRRAQEATANRTAQWLASMGREDLAAAMMSGALDPKSAAALAMTPPEQVSGVEINGKLVNPQTGEIMADFGANPKEAFGNEVELMKTYRAEPEVQAYNGVANYYGRMVSAYDITSRNPATQGQGDLAMVYSFMKMLDPGSTVMQGEYASASNTAGVPDQVRNVYNSITQGATLTDAQRRAFLEQAEGMMRSTADRLGRVNELYAGTAGRGGVNPGFLINPAIPDWRTAGVAAPPSTTFVPTGP